MHFVVRLHESSSACSSGHAASVLHPSPVSTPALLMYCLCCSLAKKKVAEKKVAITVFSFPPDKGNVGTAAYLNVFGSIYKVLQDLKAQGYTVDGVPEQEEDLIKLVSHGSDILIVNTMLMYNHLLFGCSIVWGFKATHRCYI